MNEQYTVPEPVALFKACYLLQNPRHCSWPSSNQPMPHAPAVPGFAVAPASPLRHYPLVAPRSHQHAFLFDHDPGFSMKLLEYVGIQRRRALKPVQLANRGLEQF
jgi:hypothetical protein